MKKVKYLINTEFISWLEQSGGPACDPELIKLLSVKKGWLFRLSLLQNTNWFLKNLPPKYKRMQAVCSASAGSMSVVDFQYRSCVWRVGAAAENWSSSVVRGHFSDYSPSVSVAAALHTHKHLQTHCLTFTDHTSSAHQHAVAIQLPVYSDKAPPAFLTKVLLNGGIIMKLFWSHQY